MKAKILTLLLFYLLYQSFTKASAQDAVYSIKPYNDKIQLDGKLLEPGWSGAAIADKFTQWIPHPDQPSLYRTEVRMVYTTEAIYIGAVMYQPASSQLKQITARDELNRCNADVFTVVFDPYHDKQNGFVFKVSSSGVQQDERISNGIENGDITWDAVWNSKVSSDEEKWVVEMQIPYSALRFSKAAKQDWGINFVRLVRSQNETSYWSPINFNKQGFLAQEGTLVGLENLTPPVRLFLYPYLTLGYYHKPNGSTVEQGFNRTGGLDVKYGINESFTVDATLIPDFSQVISDNLIRNLSPFEQQLTENRPFFTEGIELYNKANIFYTRRVGGTPSGFYNVQSEFGDTNNYAIVRNPNVTTVLNAVKLSGRTHNNLGIGLFNAITSPMFATVRNKITGVETREQTEPMANYNVTVLDRPLRGQSFLNFTNTNMLKVGGAEDANVSSLQWKHFFNKEKYFIDLISKWSIVQGAQSAKVGSLWNMEIGKQAGKYRFSVANTLINPNYDQSNMGLQFDLNELSQYLSTQYVNNKPKLPWLQLNRVTMNNYLRHNVKPFAFREYQMQFYYFWLFKNFWDVTFEVETKPITPVNYYFLRDFQLPLQTNPYFWTALGGSSDSRRKIFWAYYAGYGFSKYNKSGYFYAEQSLRYLFRNKLEFSVKGILTRDDSNVGYAYFDETAQMPVVGQRFVRQYEGIMTLKYNISPLLNVSARFRHYTNYLTYRSFHRVSSNGNWRNQSLPYQTGWDENFNLQNVDVFVNWIFRPGSRLVFSYKQWLQDALLLNSNQEGHYFNNLYQVLKTRKAYEVNLRFIYFLDYNEFRKKKQRN